MSTKGKLNLCKFKQRVLFGPEDWPESRTSRILETASDFRTVRGTYIGSKVSKVTFGMLEVIIRVLCFNDEPFYFK